MTNHELCGYGSASSHLSHLSHPPHVSAEQGGAAAISGPGGHVAVGSHHLYLSTFRSLQQPAAGTNLRTLNLSKAGQILAEADA
jgi:hypothetical protein